MMCLPCHPPPRIHCRVFAEYVRTHAARIGPWLQQEAMPTARVGRDESDGQLRLDQAACFDHGVATTWAHALAERMAVGTSMSEPLFGGMHL